MTVDVYGKGRVLLVSVVDWGDIGSNLDRGVLGICLYASKEYLE